MAEAVRAKIIIATHKQYEMPDDPLYLPVHVGAEGKVDADGNELDLGYTRDNTGDNISDKNSGFCELTGLYWAWKHLDDEYIGLAHYRRHFSLKKAKDPRQGILTYAQLEPYLGKKKVFVPKKRHYYIETLYSHYKHTHYAEQLDATEAIIRELYPEYLKSYDKVIKQTYGYMFNMMILRKDLMDSYCSWLFDILFELENRMGETGLDYFQGRFYGRVGEIIFNVWLDHQIQTGVLKKNEVMEIPCVHMEKINWRKKGMAFLKAKFLGAKYEGSF